MTYRTPTLAQLFVQIAEVERPVREEIRLWHKRALRDWHALSERRGSAHATRLSAYVRAVTRKRGPMQIVGSRPGRYVAERDLVISATGASPASRVTGLKLLDALWDLVPYGADPTARYALLGCLRAATRFQRRHFAEIVALAAWLIAEPGAGLATAGLPLELRRAEDSATLPSRVVAHRLAQASDETYEAALDLLPDERLRRIAGYYGPTRFLRRFTCSSSVGVAMLFLSDYLSLRRLPAWEGLRQAWEVLDELCVALGWDDGDPLAAQRNTRRYVVTDEALECLEHLRFLDYAEAIAAGANPQAAWERCYAGMPHLRQLLSVLDVARDGVVVERLLDIPPRPKGRGARSQGVEADEEQLDLETQAELFVSGLRVLRGDRSLLRVWVVLWATMCRPRECLPAREDLVPLEGGWAVYLSRAVSKSGRREAYASASACRVTGLKASWFEPSRGRSLSDAELERHAELARRACELVRDGWVAMGRSPLPDRKAYLVRKCGGDRLRWGLAGKGIVVTRVLGHLTGVSDWTYTFVSRSELTEVLRRVAARLGGILP